ncbi:hypothetical protein ACVTTK_04090 [Alcaligenes nematophilus]|jgi:hypothetical protein
MWVLEQGSAEHAQAWLQALYLREHVDFDGAAALLKAVIRATSLITLPNCSTFKFLSWPEASSTMANMPLAFPMMGCAFVQCGRYRGDFISPLRRGKYAVT